MYREFRVMMQVNTRGSEILKNRSSEIEFKGISGSVIHDISATRPIGYSYSYCVGGSGIFSLACAIRIASWLLLGELPQQLDCRENWVYAHRIHQIFQYDNPSSIFMNTISTER